MRKVLTRLLVLWVPFSLGMLFAIPVSLALIVVSEDVDMYTRDLLRAMDKTCAALFGWGGFYTISAECGSRRKHCRFCRMVQKLFELIGQPEHNVEAAKNEGLLL